MKAIDPTNVTMEAVQGVIQAAAKRFGTTTPTTGILDISAAEYFAIPALSHSGMKDLAVSPLRFWHCHVNPERAPREETPAMRLGSALHCAVLESPEEFDRRYACALDPSEWVMKLDTISELREWITSKGHKPKGTKKDEVIVQALAIMAEIGETIPIVAEEERRFFAANAGKVILQPDEYLRLTGMCRALLHEPPVDQILSEGKPEVAMVATDPETGVLLKCKVDWMAPRVTFDVKTFTQMRGKSIDKSIADAIFYEGYYLQAYFYDYVRSLATGAKSGSFDSVWAFVESDAPHETRIKAFRRSTAGQPNIYWMQAQTLIRAMIRQYADCMKQFGARPWRVAQQIDPLIDEDVRQFSY